MSDNLVERLGWHHEHPVTGEMVLINPYGPEAAALILQQQAENAELRGERDALSHDLQNAQDSLDEEWRRAVAAEAEVTRLNAKVDKVGKALGDAAAMLEKVMDADVRIIWRGTETVPQRAEVGPAGEVAMKMLPDLRTTLSGLQKGADQ